MSETARKPGRPRTLKKEDSPIATPPIEEPVGPITTERIVTNDKGESSVLSFQGFDMNKIDRYKPYNGKEELPRAEIRYRKRNGAPYIVKNGAPRFFFNGDKLIAKHRGLAVKTRLACYCRAAGFLSCHR